MRVNQALRGTEAQGEALPTSRGWQRAGPHPVPCSENSAYAESSLLLQRYNSELLPSAVFLGIHKAADDIEIKSLIFPQ